MSERSPQDPPERIFIEHSIYDPVFHETGSAWSEIRRDASDVEYVRADIVHRLTAFKMKDNWQKKK